MVENRPYVYFRKSTTKRSSIIHIGVWSLRIAISVARVITILVTFMIFSLLLMTINDREAILKNAVINNYTLGPTKYLHQTKSESTKQHYKIFSKMDPSPIPLTMIHENINSQSLQSIFSNKDMKQKFIKKDNQSEKIRHQYESTTSKYYKTTVYRRPNKIKKKEIPFNVTGWPMGVSFSVEDYVDYFGITSTLLPDSSKDSSLFEESNNHSVLIAVGKLT